MGKLIRQPPRPLRVLRAEQDLTQGVVAAQAGVTQTRYWQIEHGQGTPLRVWERTMIARVLGVAPEAIAWPSRTPPTRLQQTRAEAAAVRKARVAALTGDGA